MVFNVLIVVVIQARNTRIQLVLTFWLFLLVFFFIFLSRVLDGRVGSFEGPANKGVMLGRVPFPEWLC